MENIFSLKKLLLIFLVSTMFIEAVISTEFESATDNRPKVISPLEKLESGLFKKYCLYWNYFPQWITAYSKAIFVNFFKERIVKVGATAECLELLLMRDYMLPSRSQTKRLRESNLPILWVLGGPGSGKGTMCSLFKEAESFTHISVGDLLRAEIANSSSSFSSQLLLPIMERGDLVPDYIAVTVVIRKMMSSIDNTKGFLLDGLPRSVGQAKLFQSTMKKAPDAIVVLEASESTLLQRVLARNQGRPDDNEKTFKNRLTVYQSQSEAIISNKMFAEKVIRVNVEGSLNENFARFSQSVKMALKLDEAY